MIAASRCVPHTVQKEVRADDSIILRSSRELAPVAHNIGEWLHQWVEKTLNRVFIAEQDGPGWREVNYKKCFS